ncbi:hypothetical protein CHELA1G11_13408 [Hyphomicrobiales bacterium]|nr:hypothetical protein CHELA1G11_13408 [Hyphomicrobiales bacterium]
MIGADDEQRAVLLENTAAGREPGTGERVIFGETIKLVPVVIDRIDETIVRSRQRTLKLQIIGRVGEDEIDAVGRKGIQGGNAIANQNLIDGKRMKFRRFHWHPRPGTRDLTPGRGSSGMVKSNAHDAIIRLRN